MALAIVALTTTMFTSCEKENIGIEVTPVNAKFIITPVVIDATTGTDVTQSAEISFSKGNGTYEGTPELASESININAKYKGNDWFCISYYSCTKKQVNSVQKKLLLS